MSKGSMTDKKKMTLTSRLFRKMQTKFTVLIALICLVLVTVSFVAMLIVNTIIMEMSVNDMMDEAIGIALEDMAKPPSEDEEGSDSDCLVVLDRSGEFLVFGELGGDVTLSDDDLKELISAAIRDEQSVRINDMVVRVRVLRDEDSIGRFSVYAFYDFTARYNIYVSQTLGVMFSFIGLSVILTLFSYMMSGFILSPARDALVRQKDLVANASHELKTPITIINANLDVIKNAPSDADNSKWITNIEAQTKRMNNLIIEMLEMSSFESDAYKPEITEFDLGELAEGSCLAFEAACYEKGIGVEYESEGNTVVRSDEKGWSKLIGILMDNAVKYTPERGRITVRLERRKKSVCMTVSNDGEIPSDKIDKIFDRFYKTGDNSGSFGLGLAMAKVITGGMNGNISCTSGNGRTVFTVNVPIKD